MMVGKVAVFNDRLTILAITGVSNMRCILTNEVGNVSRSQGEAGEDNINFIFKIPIHFVLECIAIEVAVWTGSKGHIRSVESRILSETIILPHDHER